MTIEFENGLPKKHGLYDPAFEKDSCGAEPVIEQMVVAAEDTLDRTSFCRQLYLIRKQAFHDLKKRDLRDRHMYYVASFSARIIIFKVQLTSKQVVPYFPDLGDPRYT